MKLQIDNTITSVINAIPNPVILSNGGELQSCNNAFLEFFAVASIEEFNSRYSCIDKLFIKHNGFFTRNMIDTSELWTDFLYARPYIKRMVSLVNKDNELRDFEITLKKIENQSEYIIVFTDITSHISEKNEYKYFAHHDHLTKIYNRQKFDESFIKEIENKKRYGDNLSIILIDIDHFKLVNDTYGHIIGDLVLIALVNMLALQLRVNDTLARWGGEEFIILLPRTDIDAAYAKAKELREIVEAHSDKELPKITISLGVTEFMDTDNSDTCLQRVDNALFMAKVKRNDVAML